MQRLRNAFTMLELVFVIIIMGIVGTIGVEIFRNAYDAYMSSAVNQKLQSETELALKQIANRLQYRFKDSVIGRIDAANFDGLSSVNVDLNYTAIEWVGYDIDGWLGDETSTLPTWSGFIDVDDPSASINRLISPETNTTGRVDDVIKDLAASGSTTDIFNSAIFFTGANTNIQTGYGWDSGELTEQNGSAAHRVSPSVGNPTYLIPTVDDFDDIDIYEQYKLAWTAYALALEGKKLFLYYDYQPWEGEEYNETGINNVNVADRKRLLVDNVSTFKFQAIGDILRVQLCVDNNATGNVPAQEYYSLCKEKVIF
jgi:prepilin-type N-terminal cleavage/methylation domain-containing protein